MHLFGQDSFKRATLMTGLEEAYLRAGCRREGELPDHLGVVLSFAAAFDDAEWDELVRLCLAKPLVWMARALERAGNPYLHLVRAVTRLVGTPLTLPPAPAPGPRRAAPPPGCPAAPAPVAVEAADA